MTFEKGRHPLVCETFSDVCFDKTQDISPSNVIIGYVSVVDKSENGNGLGFIEGIRSIRRLRFICTFGAVFF
jgi:hypothetical protein